MNLAEQILLEAAATGRIALAIFVRYGRPVGAGTEEYGLNFTRFVPGLLSGAGVESSAFMLQYCAEGCVLFVAVDDEDKALSELCAMFSRFDCEETSWIARHSDGTWADIFPTRGAARTIPAEIVLLPARFYALEQELQTTLKKLEEIDEELRQRRELLDSGRVIDALASDDIGADAAWVRERLDAIRSEMAKIKIEAFGLQKIS